MIRNFTTKTIIITEQENLTLGENLIYESITFDKQLTKKITDISYKYGIQSIIIEGGKQTLETFIADNLWDEAFVFIGNISLNEGIKAPLLNEVSKVTDIKDDQLKLFLNHD